MGGCWLRSLAGAGADPLKDDECTATPVFANAFTGVMQPRPLLVRFCFLSSFRTGSAPGGFGQRRQPLAHGQLTAASGCVRGAGLSKDAAVPAATLNPPVPYNVTLVWKAL
jgi:hypothetical protein